MLFLFVCLLYLLSFITIFLSFVYVYVDQCDMIDITFREYRVQSIESSETKVECTYYEHKNTLIEALCVLISSKTLVLEDRGDQQLKREEGRVPGRTKR